MAGKQEKTQECASSVLNCVEGHSEDVLTDLTAVCKVQFRDR